MIDDLSKEMATELINKNRSDLSKYTDRGVPHEIARLAKQKAYDLEKQIRENPPKSCLLVIQAMLCYFCRFEFLYSYY